MNRQAPDAPLSETDETDHPGADQRAGIQSVEVGFTLLDVMAQAQGPLMLRDLAAAAGMSAAKAHRYLVSFQRLNLVHQDAQSTRYNLGPAALRLGLAALGRLDAVKLARERADALLEHTGHTVAIAVWGNQGPTIVHWAEAPQTVPVSLRLGDVMPLLSSATGRCFATFMEPRNRDTHRLQAMLDTELQRSRQHPQADLPQTVEQAQALWATTRQHGMGRAVNSLLSGVAGFCAPVFDAQDHLQLGLLIMGSVATLNTEWDGPVAQALRQSARQLSTDLGHTGAH
jgi:DNA-binding IclR family transcriptional regulator